MLLHKVANELLGNNTVNSKSNKRATLKGKMTCRQIVDELHESFQQL